MIQLRNINASGSYGVKSSGQSSRYLMQSLKKKDQKPWAYSRQLVVSSWHSDAMPPISRRVSDSLETNKWAHLFSHPSSLHQWDRVTFNLTFTQSDKCSFVVCLEVRQVNSYIIDGFLYFLIRTTKNSNAKYDLWQSNVNCCSYLNSVNTQNGSTKVCELKLRWIHVWRTRLLHDLTWRGNIFNGCRYSGRLGHVITPQCYVQWIHGCYEQQFCAHSCFPCLKGL